MKNYELYHHGILGQKWGIRRFQNKDGSLTSDGKKRYADDESSESNTDYEIRKQNALKYGKASDVLKYKDDLSYKELQEAYLRINLEKQLSKISQDEIESGFDKVMAVMDKVGKVTDATNKGINAYNTVAKLVNNLSNKKLKQIK